MNTAKSRAARTMVGAFFIAAALGALIWFAFQFTPGEPRPAQADKQTGSLQASSSSSLVASKINDIRVGETVRLEGLTQGKSFSYNKDEFESWSPEERERATNSDSWRYELPVLDVTATGLRTLSDDAFIEWYPHYGEARIEYSNAVAKVFLAELTVANPGDKPARIPALQLWSEELNGTSDRLDNGIYVDGYLSSELYGEPQEGFIAYRIPDDWNVLQPGETRSWTLPFLVFENAFRNPAAYKEVDPSRFCVAIADYDPATIYRLWLG